MDETHLKDLIKEEAYFLELFRRKNVFDIRDMTLIALGYDHKNVDWEDILNSNNNSYPARVLQTALWAAYKGNLEFIMKDDNAEKYMGGTTYKVSKKHFFKWAKKYFDKDLRIQKVVKYYDKYKKKSPNNSPSLTCPEAQIYDEAREMQLTLYIKYLETGKDPNNFKFKKSDLIKEMMRNSKISPAFKYNTYKKYFGNKLTLIELETMRQQNEK